MWILSVTSSDPAAPTAYGLNFNVENRASGAVTNAYGVNIGVSSYAAGTGTVTNAVGVNVATHQGTGTFINATGVSVTAVGVNAYGIYIYSVSGSSSSYGIYQPSGTKNLFTSNNAKRIETDATGIGFFGKTPAAQQTGGAATAAVAYGANEQAMLQKVYDALRAFGLLA